jgi:hypothetical protein
MLTVQKMYSQSNEGIHAVHNTFKRFNALLPQEHQLKHLILINNGVSSELIQLESHQKHVNALLGYAVPSMAAKLLFSQIHQSKSIATLVTRSTQRCGVLRSVAGGSASKKTL